MVSKKICHYGKWLNRNFVINMRNKLKHRRNSVLVLLEHGELLNLHIEPERFH